MVISHPSFLFSLLQLSSPILSLPFLPSLPMEFLSVSNTGDIISLLLGVFWIDWKSLLTFFDVIYINWKPGMFQHESTLHELVTLNLVAPIPTLPSSILSLPNFQFPFSYFSFSLILNLPFSILFQTVYGNPAVLRKTGMTSVSLALHLCSCVASFDSRFLPTLVVPSLAKAGRGLGTKFTFGVLISTPCVYCAQAIILSIH